MGRLVWGALSLLALAAPALGQKVFFFPQVGDGVVGNIRFQTTLIFVNTGTSTQATVDFFKSDGQPMQMSLEGLGPPNSTFSISLPAGGAFSVQSTAAGDPNTQQFQAGYARVTSGDGVGGTAVFVRTDVATGVTVYEAGVPAVQTLNSFSLFLDSLGEKDTGVALVNPPGTPANANLTVSLFNKDFTTVATTDLPLKVGEHTARFISEFFAGDPAQQATEMEGVVTVRSDQPLAAVTVRQNNPFTGFPDGVPTLTTFPVIPGAAQPASTGSFTVLSAQEVGTSLDLGTETRTVIGVIYRLYEGETLVKEVNRGIPSHEEAAHTIPVISSSRISRVEARLIYAGGELSAGFSLRPKSLNPV